MIKKKSKKSAAKKTAKKQSKPRGKKELNPEEVRKEISELVKSHEGKMAVAVVGEGEKGQLATVKYLWEMAEIYPPPPAGSQATTDEDSLAKTLLDRLNIPTSPVVHDELQRDEDVVVIPARVADVKQVSADESREEKKEVLAGCE